MSEYVHNKLGDTVERLTGSRPKHLQLIQDVLEELIPAIERLEAENERLKADYDQMEKEYP